MQLKLVFEYFLLNLQLNIIYMYCKFVKLIDVSYYDFIYWLRVKGARERFCLSFNRIEKSFNNRIK